MHDIESLKAASIRRIQGPTILLGSGTYFDFEDPASAELTIDDVAYGLAFACRFAGQCVERATGRRVFYAVAEHCVRMSDEAPPPLKLYALMHELGEATCGDMTGPLKTLCPDYKGVEKRCEAAAMQRFGIPPVDLDAIKLLDLRMLATERRDLMPWSGESWAWVKGAEPFDFAISPWDPYFAAEQFLDRYQKLAGGVSC
jgi:hypothetical protein